MASASRGKREHTDGWCATNDVPDLRDMMAKRLNALEAAVNRCSKFMAPEVTLEYRRMLDRLAAYYGLTEVKDEPTLR